MVFSPRNIRTDAPDALITEDTTRVSGALRQEPGQRPVHALSLISQQHACMPFPPVSCSYSCSLGSLSEINYLHASLGLRFCFLGEHGLRYQLRRGAEGAPKMAAEGSPRVTAGQEPGEYPDQTGKWRPHEGCVSEIGWNATDLHRM